MERYIICYKGQYVSRTSDSRYIVTTDIAKACKWGKFQTVNNVFHSNIRSILQRFPMQICILNESDGSITYADGKLDIREMCDEAVLDFDIMEKVKEITTIHQQLEARSQWLACQISKIDKEIVDIEHAAEFYNLDACRGYKLYKLLHDTEVKRREYKNELSKIQYCFKTSINNTSITHLQKSIAGLDNQKYTPRINKELFKA